MLKNLKRASAIMLSLAMAVQFGMAQILTLRIRYQKNQ